MQKQSHLNQHSLVLGSYQLVPLEARVDLEAMAMKGYSVFPKAQVLLEPNIQIV